MFDKKPAFPVRLFDRGAPFVLDGGLEPAVSKSQRRRLFALLRMAHRVIGLVRRHLGVGLFGPSAALKVSDRARVVLPLVTRSIHFSSVISLFCASIIIRPEEVRAAKVDVSFPAGVLNTCISQASGTVYRVNHGNTNNATAGGIMPGSGPGTYGWVSGCATIGTGLGYTVLGSFANGGNFTGVTAIGLGARAGANFATAVGVESVATGEASSAYGTGSIASANNAISIGGGGAAKLGANLSTRATANGAIAIGVNDTSGAAATAVNAIALGPQSLAARDGAVAIGLAAAANGNVGDIALGSNSTTQLVVNTTGTNINGASYSFAGSNATSTVSIGSSTAPRTMTNLAAGRLAATSTDAINGSQLFSTNQAVEAVGNRVTKNEGDISSLQTGLATTNTNVTNLGNRVTTVDDRVTNLSQTIGSGAIGLVRQNGADAQLTVGAETGGTNVNMAGTSGNRTVSGVATGVVAATSTDAINGSQLFSTNQAVEAVGNRVTKNEGDISSLQTGLATTNTNVTNLGNRVTTVDDRVTNLSQTIGSGAIGLVRQNGADAQLTVGAETGGTNVNMAGTSGNRTVSGVATGVVAATSTDAINGSQLFSTNQAVEAVGNRVTKNEGDISSLQTGLATTNTNVTNLGNRVTTVDDRVTNLSQTIGSGAIGLVRQNGADAQLTVGAETGGTNVNMAGTSGNRTVSGVATGVVAATSTDAINGSQLFSTNQAVEAVGNRVTKNEGDISSLQTGLATTNTNVTNLGNRVTTVDDRVTNLSQTIGSGAIGLVRQNGADAQLTVGAETGGTNVNMAGTSGNRTVSGVATGVVAATSTDAINGSQLFSTNQAVEAVGNRVTKNEGDISSLQTGLATTNTNVTNLGNRVTTVDDRVTNLSQTIGSGAIGLVRQNGADAQLTVGAETGGTNVNMAGTSGNRTVSGVATGVVAATSTDAINGSQLFSTNQAVEAVGNRVTKNEGDISSLQTGLATTNTNVTNLGNRVTTVDDRVTNLSQTIGSGAIGLVRQNGADAQLTVGAETGGTNVNMAGTSGNRTVSGVATGVVAATSTDAINGSQLFSTNQAVEAVGNRVTKNEGDISSLQTGLATTNTNVTNLGNRVTTVDDRVTNLSQTIGSGAIGLVRQNGADAQLTVGAETGGTNVNMAGTSGNRTVSGVATGVVAATSTDAINGSQLFSTNQAVEAVGNRVTKNEGDISSLQTGLATTNTNVTNLGNRVTTVDDRVTNLSQTIGSGAIGLVRQNGADAQLTVGAETGGTNVNMAGTSGNRTVSGVATGVVAATSTDAINGSQLFSTNQAVEAVGSKIDQVVNATNNTIQYDIDQRGTRRNSVTLQGGDVNNPVVLSNVAVGSKDTDAVNLSQMRDSSKDTLSSANEYTDARSQQIVSQVQTHVKGYVENASTGILDEAKKHTNDRFNLLSGEISGVRREAHQAAAIGLAAASLRFDDRPGKLSAAIGGGMWRGAGAAAFGLGYTSPDQQMRFNVSATTGGGDWGVGVGMSFTLN
ncbi:YadA-like family protein [Agrobacterium radiobacter]|uniref:beta strand repeat-containing protein n=1 Tax=Agrobacterium radiobacter TaxID=362 RepID=UPI0034659EF8